MQFLCVLLRNELSIAPLQPALLGRIKETPARYLPKTPPGTKN